MSLQQHETNAEATAQKLKEMVVNLFIPLALDLKITHQHF